MNDSPARIVVLAGGGSAGHIEPALAVARAWLAKFPNDRCIFLGTRAGLESTLVPAAGFELFYIDKVVMPRKLNIDIVNLPWQLFASVKSARKLVQEADVLIGFGGYISATAYLAAKFSGVPFTVHEANAKVGWANRLGGLLTSNLAVSRPFTSGRFSKARVTGLPLRQDVQSAYVSASKDWERARGEAKRSLGWDAVEPVLLVLGGSQGSTFINSEIAEAISTLERRGIRVLHSVGLTNEIPESSESYKALPYITDMGAAYLAADVVLARSGAVTCAEVGALSRMAIFVPLPIGNGEQERNATQLVASGRAIVIAQSEFTSKWLLENIDALIKKSRGHSEPAKSQDLEAEQKIIELMENAMQGSSR